MPHLARCLAIVALALSGHGAAAQEVELRIGVRTDAAPFSYQRSGRRASTISIPGPLINQGYDGFVVYLCDRALLDLQRQMGDRLKVVPVNVQASNRFEELRNGGIDLLCDPATITRERVREFLASMPIYISGITFAKQPEIPPQYCGSIAGIVGRTTAETNGIHLILDNGEWPQFEPLVRDYLTKGDEWTEPNHACNALVDTGQAVAGSRPVPIRLFDNHIDAAAAFCDSEILYYVGDIEIVERNLAAVPDCAYSLARVTYTEERYAIFARTDFENPETGLLTLRFLESLARIIYASPSALDQAFVHTFSGYQPTEKLQFFNWSIRGIPRAEN
ncbi:transporter substrate-binding domain-containing protein [Aliiroseovarius sp. YM-037]|uniref:transporter substrate-binding domain-containing protein n=1 Tax=Aliiroseovarius sp. YM-037 TaxID=3341728 RepID=UPI003A7FA7FF